MLCNERAQVACPTSDQVRLIKEERMGEKKKLSIISLWFLIIRKKKMADFEHN